MYAKSSTTDRPNWPLPQKDLNTENLPLYGDKSEAKNRHIWTTSDDLAPPKSLRSRTGHAAPSRVEAERALAAYIATKGRDGAANEPGNVTCDEVFRIYAEEYAPTVAAPERIAYALDALLPFWGSLKVSHIKGETCRRYGKTRKKVAKRDPETGEPIEFAPISHGTIRRELGTLQAAINYAHKEGYLTSAPVVTLPEKPEGRERWLTRSEAARLLWSAYRGHKSKHISRFILIALYTGTRKDAILRMGFERNTVGGWFDLDAGLMYRKGEAERATAKRRKPAKIPRPLLAHLRRWRASGCMWAVAVDYKGEAYAVSRYVGIKAKQVRDRFGDLSALPDVATAQNEAAQDVQTRLEELRREEEHRKAEEEARHKAEQSRIRTRQVQEAAQLQKVQQKREHEAQTARNAKIRTGWRGLIDRITGQRRKTLEDNARAQEQARQRDEQERQTAAARQSQQLAATQTRAKAEQQKRTNTIKELRNDFNALEASKEAERQRAKEAFKRDRKNRATRPKRRSRAPDGLNLER
ncbi:MAG: hypothetical protein N4A53_13735 [Pelagimonas sp.]|jgi:hypothetical protein|nr:hypothetical protein [Pelagimonas sp.]